MRTRAKSTMQVIIRGWWCGKGKRWRQKRNCQEWWFLILIPELSEKDVILKTCTPWRSLTDPLRCWEWFEERTRKRKVIEIKATDDLSEKCAFHHNLIFTHHKSDVLNPPVEFQSYLLSAVLTLWPRRDTVNQNLILQIKDAKGSFNIYKSYSLPML